MKKILVLLIVVLLTGCGTNESNKKNVKRSSTNIYMNTDKNCAGVERIEKEYRVTNPKKILDEVEYCFIGTLIDIKESKIYDNGKIKTKINIAVESVVKGDMIDNELEVYRDGGSTSINTYVDYPKDTCISKSSLKAIPENLRVSHYVEIVPTAYFEAEIGTKYLFFVSKSNTGELEIYNDAYGMLKVVSDDTVQNVYTNEKYIISDLSRK